jgi:pimeloyl-ACP methyl ester carboxylesterase
MPIAGRLRYLEAQPAPSARARGTLVLLHAFPLNGRMWEGQLSFAQRGWHVIAPHVRGADGGPYASPVTSIDDYAGDLVDLLDALHVEDAVVAGLSMGGYLAFALLRHAAAYVRGLVLADTKAEADTAEALAARKAMLELVEKEGVGPVADAMIPKLLGETTRATRPAVVEQVRTLIHANSKESTAGAVRALMSRPDSTPLLKTIHVPTLIVVGEEDIVTPPSAAEAMHRGIAGSELIRIPGAGHLSNLEEPEAFNAALARFLDHRV